MHIFINFAFPKLLASQYGSFDVGFSFNKMQKCLQILCKNCAYVIILALSYCLVFLACLNTQNLPSLYHLPRYLPS